MQQPIMAGQLQGGGAESKRSAAPAAGSWRCSAGLAVLLVAGCLLLNAGLLASIRSRLTPAGATNPRLPAPAGGSAAGTGDGGLSGIQER